MVEPAGVFDGNLVGPGALVDLGGFVYVDGGFKHLGRLEALGR